MRRKIVFYCIKLSKLLSAKIFYSTSQGSLSISPYLHTQNDCFGKKLSVIIYFEICHFKADLATIQKESWISEANVNPNCKPTLDVIQIPLKWGTYLLPLEDI